MTVEKRAQMLYGEDYEAIPSDWDLKQMLFEKTRAEKESTNPLQQSILTLKDKLWPVIFIQRVCRTLKWFKLNKYLHSTGGHLYCGHPTHRWIYTTWK